MNMTMRTSVSSSEVSVEQAEQVARRRPAVLMVLLVVAGLTLSACGPSTEDLNTSAINNVRASVGFHELVRAPELDAKARKHAERMARQATIFHSSNLASGVPAGWLGIGENVAMAGSVEQAQAALEASPGHYANMVGDYDQVGIGVVTRNGVVYVVQIFVNR